MSHPPAYPCEDAADSVAPMRRLLPLSAICLLALAACGSDSPSASKSTTAGTESCASTSTTAGSTPSTTATKPDVKIPATIPTELVVTDLVEGTGDPAKEGDTVVVNYVGVRSADGTEFDNSYDRGQTFPVTIGQTSVIQGWTQGLVGIKAGGRRQLDIPASLAYGDQGSGDKIKPGDALSFVIDAVSVTPGVTVPDANPADKPKVDIPTNQKVTEVTTKDLVTGTGAEAKPCQTAYLQITAYRGDTGAELQSTWTNGKATPITLDEQTIPGLVKGVEGMKVGGRRLITVPPADAFGETGNTSVGLPGGANLVLVVDLVQLQDAPA